MNHTKVSKQLTKIIKKSFLMPLSTKIPKAMEGLSALLTKAVVNNTLHLIGQRLFWSQHLQHLKWDPKDGLSLTINGNGLGQIKRAAGGLRWLSLLQPSWLGRLLSSGSVQQTGNQGQGSQATTHTTTSTTTSSSSTPSKSYVKDLLKLYGVEYSQPDNIKSWLQGPLSEFGRAYGETKGSGTPNFWPKEKVEESFSAGVSPRLSGLLTKMTNSPEITKPWMDIKSLKVAFQNYESGNNDNSWLTPYANLFGHIDPERGFVAGTAGDKEFKIILNPDYRQVALKIDDHINMAAKALGEQLSNQSDQEIIKTLGNTPAGHILTLFDPLAGVHPVRENIDRLLSDPELDTKLENPEKVKRLIELVNEVRGKNPNNVEYLKRLNVERNNRREITKVDFSGGALIVKVTREELGKLDQKATVPLVVLGKYIKSSQGEILPVVFVAEDVNWRADYRLRRAIESFVNFADLYNEVDTAAKGLQRAIDQMSEEKRKQFHDSIMEKFKGLSESNQRQSQTPDQKQLLAQAVRITLNNFNETKQAYQEFLAAIERTGDPKNPSNVIINMAESQYALREGSARYKGSVTVGRSPLSAILDRPFSPLEGNDSFRLSHIVPDRSALWKENLRQSLHPHPAYRTAAPHVILRPRGGRK